MEGRLCSLDIARKSGRVDTRNDQLGVLTIYFSAVPPGLTADATVRFDVVTSRLGNVYARFTGLVERNPARFNTEDRDKWYVWGEGQEDFAAMISRKTGRDIQRNPEKKICPWAIDLYDYTAGRYADLKIQNTPFFTAGKYAYCGVPCDPAFTVTFNREDYDNYQENYPGCDIYFWVDWQQLVYREITVPHVSGVWRAPFTKMAERIEAGHSPLHPYLHRRHDDHNARDSFLFDLRDEAVFTPIE